MNMECCKSWAEKSRYETCFPLGAVVASSLPLAVSVLELSVFSVFSLRSTFDS